jgi:hypothetical protein
MKDFTSSILESKGWEMFRAGWRPTIGWVCGLALLYNFIARDIIVIFTERYGEPAQMEHLITILVTMLGLGGMRTYEKIKQNEIKERTTGID